MFRLYVLKSLRSGKKYVGVTSQSLDVKLKEHNNGAGLWTRGHRPFELVYSEEFSNKTTALVKEKFYKTGDGRRVLDRKIKEFFSTKKRGGENFAEQNFPR